MGDGLKSGPRGKIGAECPAGEDPDPSRLQRSRGVRGPWQAAQGNLRKDPRSERSFSGGAGGRALPGSREPPPPIRLDCPGPNP